MKEDRTNINLQELIYQKFKELKEAKCYKPKEEDVEETSCIIDTQMIKMSNVPKLNDILHKCKLMQIVKNLL